jgi:hypothetical protein
MAFGIVDILVDFLVLVISAVIGFGIFYSTSTSGWSTVVVSIWQYVPLVFIACGIIILIAKVKFVGH